MHLQSLPTVTKAARLQRTASLIFVAVALCGLPEGALTPASCSPLTVAQSYRPMVTHIRMRNAAVRLAAAVPLSLGPLGALFPGLAHVPTPSWLKPGLRLVYTGGDATVDGMNLPRSPSHFCSTGPAHFKNRLVSGGGAGMTTVDVVAIEAGVVVMSLSIYIQPNGPGTPPQLSSTTTVFGAPGAGSDFWMSPSILRKFKGLRKAITVMRMPYQLNGRSVPSVWIKTNSSNGYFVYVYEASTGLLIHYGSTIQGATGRILGTGDLSERRVVRTPWLSRYSPPAAVRNGHFQYSGTTDTSIPGSIPLRTGINVTLAASSHGAEWVNFKQSIHQPNGMGQMVVSAAGESASGPGQLIPVWLPPLLLSQLSEGQELDSDPVTQVTTSVAQRQRGPDGAGVVMISQVSQVQQFQYGYNMTTGMMVYLSRTDTVGPATIRNQIYLQR